MLAHLERVFWSHPSDANCTSPEHAAELLLCWYWHISIGQAIQGELVITVTTELQLLSNQVWRNSKACLQLLESYLH